MVVAENEDAEFHSLTASNSRGTVWTNTLLAPIELIDEAALFHFVDEAKLDEIFRFGFAGAWIGERLYVERLLQTFERRVGVFNQKFVIGRVGAFEHGSVQAAGIFLHDLDRVIFTRFEVMARFGQRPDDATNLIGIFSNLLPGRHAAVKLERHLELGHIDNHFEPVLFTLEFFSFADDCKIRLSGNGCAEPRRCTAERDGFNVFVANADFHQSQPEREVRRGAGNMHRSGLTAQVFRRLDARVADDEVRQRIHLALNDRDLGTRELGVDDGRPHRAAVAEIAGDQTLNAAHAAIDKYRIEIEAVLFEDTGLFGDPVDHR